MRLSTRSREGSTWPRWAARAPSLSSSVVVASSDDAVYALSVTAWASTI
jgi:hypothetical protein